MTINYENHPRTIIGMFRLPESRSEWIGRKYIALSLPTSEESKQTDGHIELSRARIL